MTPACLCYLAEVSGARRSDQGCVKCVCFLKGEGKGGVSIKPSWTCLCHAHIQDLQRKKEEIQKINKNKMKKQKS